MNLWYKTKNKKLNHAHVHKINLALRHDQDWFRWLWGAWQRHLRSLVTFNLFLLPQPRHHPSQKHHRRPQSCSSLFFRLLNWKIGVFEQLGHCTIKSVKTMKITYTYTMKIWKFIEFRPIISFFTLHSGLVQNSSNSDQSNYYYSNTMVFTIHSGLVQNSSNSDQ